MRIIAPQGMPAPKGHYSHAIEHNGVLYVSGQLGRTDSMSDADAGDIATQTRRALGNVIAIVRAAGVDLPAVLKVCVYVPDVAHWPAVNAVYAEIFGAHRPARVVVPTGPLHFGALIEVDAIAAVP